MVQIGVADDQAPQVHNLTQIQCTREMWRKNKNPFRLIASETLRLSKENISVKYVYHVYLQLLFETFFAPKNN
jgi:hypothetical protein